MEVIICIASIICLALFAAVIAYEKTVRIVKREYLRKCRKDAENQRDIIMDKIMIDDSPYLLDMLDITYEYYSALTEDTSYYRLVQLNIRYCKEMNIICVKKNIP